MKLSNSIMAAAAGLGLATAAVGANAAVPTDRADFFCNLSLTTPESVREMTPLADGVSYAAVAPGGESIRSYSYKTGEETGVLFDLASVKGDVKINSFEGFRISANEKNILLWNNSVQIYRNSFTAEYYVYDIMRNTLARVSENGPQRGAMLSHDGRMVAYVRDNNIFISNLDYKTDKAITTDGALNSIINGMPDWAYEEEFGMITAMRWSPDDATLAYIRFDESRVPVYSFDQYKSYCEENPLSDIYPASYSYKYPLAGYPNSTVEVFAYNLDNRTTKKMDLPIGAEDYVPSMEFDGSGTNLMVMLLNRDQNDLRLYKVSPGSTVAHLVITEKSDAWLSPSAYQMVNYGDKSFIIGSERTGYRHLYEYDYSGNLLRNVTSGNWNVTDFYGRDPKSGLCYVQTTQLGAINRNVASVDAKGNVKMLNAIEGTESASFSRNFAYYLRKYSSATIPPRYSLCNASGKEIKMIQDNAEYAARYASVPKMEFIKLRNAVGEEMNAMMIKPAGFDPSKKYPLLVYQYNGPDSQLVLNSWKMDGTYLFADQGYVVVSMDGRGTGNRNRDWATSVYRHLGSLETADQLAGVKELSKLPYVDEARMACFGWSYGGYMTLMEMTDPASPFKAGVAMAPVTDWRFYDSIYTERYMTTPGANESGYDSASALRRSQDLKGRLLIMSGTSDDNVHFYNTLKFVSKANYEGKILDMMALPGFEHSLRMCNARTMLYSKILDFLNANVR